MKRILLASCAAAIFLGVVGLIYVGAAKQPNWQRVFVAAQIYREQLTMEGQAMPVTVSLDDLMARNLLKAGDAIGLEGVKIRLPAVRNEQEPQALLMEVTLPDGTRLAALADGSVGSLPRNTR